MRRHFITACEDNMFHGSIVALVTPMREDGSIDWHALENLVNWHVAAGTGAIVSVGTTGESATLTYDEHKAVTRFTVEIAKKRIPVIAGAGANSTAEAIELTYSAYHSGCDATLQVAPYYNKPPQRGLYEHFRKVAEAVPLPVILYNVPGRTSVDIAPETVFALAKTRGIVGIKEASTLERLAELAAHFGVGKKRDFALYCGNDDINARAFAAGYIDGVISVTANVAPAELAAICQAGRSGNGEEALALDASLASLHEAMFVEANPIPVKWAVARMGLCGGTLRLPMTPLSKSNEAVVEGALRSSGLL